MLIHGARPRSCNRTLYTKCCIVQHNKVNHNNYVFVRESFRGKQLPSVLRSTERSMVQAVAVIHNVHSSTAAVKYSVFSIAVHSVKGSYIRVFPTACGVLQ